LSGALITARMFNQARHPNETETETIVLAYDDDNLAVAFIAEEPLTTPTSSARSATASPSLSTPRRRARANRRMSSQVLHYCENDDRVGPFRLNSCAKRVFPRRAPFASWRPRARRRARNSIRSFSSGEEMRRASEIDRSGGESISNGVKK